MQRGIKDSPSSGVRCGIVLSAGNGTRMREFVYRRRGDYLPKQYINFTGKLSMLEHTFRRAEKLIPAQRLFTVVAREHLKFNEVRRQIAWRPQQTIVIQPQNKDTAPGILLPIAYLYKQHPDAAVVIFPSDHFVLEEDLFMRHVDLAFRLVDAERSRMVLLGVEPECADPEYGYIVPGQDIDDSGLSSARIVEAFVEKPTAEAAEKISRRGALWNTLVLVVKAKTLLDVFQRATPELYYSFQPVLKAIGTPDEQHVIEQVYQELAPVNFSKAILEALPSMHRRALLVLAVRGVTWSDWGASDRLLNTLRRMRTRLIESKAAYSQGEKHRVFPRGRTLEYSLRGFKMLREIKFDEDGDFLLQSDAIDQYQYFRSFRTGAADEPERRLMLAILEDALRCLEKYSDARTRRGNELYWETEEWLLSDSDDWIFSFSNVCEALGLNPAYIRKRVLC